MSSRQYFMLFLALFLLSACSHDTLSVVFDIPPPTPEEIARREAEKAKKRIDIETDKLLAIKKMPPHKLAAEVTKAKDWGTALNYLPKDMVGQPDWLTAMEKRIITPRSKIGSDINNQFIFGFDFYLKGPSPMFDAFFPHSQHTKLLDCSNCHPKVFKYRGTKITMNDIRAGKFCGVCHGPVAFPVDIACVRCHTGMMGGQ